MEVRNGHVSSKYFESDLAGLRDPMVIPYYQPEIFREVKIGYEGINHTVNLVMCHFGTIKNGSFNHGNTTTLHPCSSCARGEKEIDSERQGLRSSHAPKFFWKTLRVRLVSIAEWRVLGRMATFITPVSISFGRSLRVKFPSLCL
ncbi:hypothetical protein AJ78_07629 [Emergomyces pasteurianus Ep9510]|uniref:Uncharacterized protein n=1 Tax=Emergomyces pasteurianus Ep9510 TaxID=1447872 RepID=A0A1J9PUU4_9EURO|nr:hypothetical protein AJ78_07629 [Emergomyces pasteurianus Ep9510]